MILLPSLPRALIGLAALLGAFAAGLSAVPKCDRILYEHISPQTNTEHLTSGKSSILEDGFLKHDTAFQILKLIA